MIKPDQAILNRIRGFSAIQWTGKELAIGNYTGYPRASVDRIRIEGSKAIFAHGTNLRESQGISVFWIENGIVVVPQNSGVADLWHFPGGGKPFGAISVFATGGVVVSPGRK
jgi:hypothetical protein